MEDELWEDMQDVSTNDSYRVLVSRDGPVWVTRTYGSHLPVEGAEARSNTFADVQEETFRQPSRFPAPKRNDGIARGENWSFEYALGADTDSKLEAYRQAGMALHQAEAEREQRGHDIAADLAATHGATPAEIASILYLCCAEQAAELVAYQGPRLVAFAQCPHEPPPMKDPLVVTVGWWLRDLVDVAWDRLHADVAWDKLQQVRDRRRVSRA